MKSEKEETPVAGCACGGGCCGAEASEAPVGGHGWGVIVAGALLFALSLALPLQGWPRVALFLAAYGVSGWGPLRAVLRNIAHGRVFDENFLMLVATAGALAIGQYPEAVAVMLFYQVGEAIQDLAVGHSRRSIRELVDLRADTASVLREGAFVTVNPVDVAVGDVILVKPGERVPLDGEVIEGFSALDLSALTGESLPRDVVIGGEVLAGGVNLTGVLRLRVTRPYGQTTVARILALVQDAASRKARTEALITRFARVYTPAVIALAALVMALGPVLVGGTLSTWVYRGLVFLVASCPCALLISIPLGFFGGIGGASRQGILVKGGNYLEALAQVRTVVFDKTGTLTCGTFAVSAIHPSDGFSSAQVLDYAAHAEMHSSHPLAKSVVSAYGQPRLDRVGEVRETAGQGVSASVDGRRVLVGNAAFLRTVGVEVPPAPAGEEKGLWVAVDGQAAGYLSVSDTVKSEAAQAVRELRALGVERIAMLTGDSESAARAVASAVGVDEFHAGLLPDEKVALMRSERGRLPPGGVLAYVGDGINDAPVLAEADVGIAMGALGSDSAIEASDVVIMNDDLTRIGAAVRQARATRRVVAQNIVFALAVKAAVLAGSLVGLAAMWEAVFADVGVALLATLNAVRLIRKQGPIASSRRRARK
jgi:Cd2+/Zn2+-exporting ATPase